MIKRILFILFVSNKILFLYPQNFKNFMIKSVIKGYGYYVPDNVVTNDDLSKLMTTNDEWITERTGIKERRHRKNRNDSEETTAVFAKRASEKALEKSGSYC